VDLGLELEAQPLAAERIGRRRWRDRAVEGDRPRVALDREVARPRNGVVVVTDELRRAERDLGEALRVEEVGRLEMAVQLLVLDVDRRDLRAAVERVARQRGAEVAEAAAERVHTRVPDLERDVR